MNTERHFNQTGFTLLEALVTIVVISIGLLGLLGLQTVSIANTQNSAARSDASIAADNMADRIRVNVDGAKNSDYDGISNPSAGAMPAACDGATLCSASQMAANDAYQWDMTLARILPNGRGYVSCTTRYNSKCVAYTITIAWSERDRGTSATATNQTIDRCKATGSLVGAITDQCFQTQVRP